MVLTKSEIDLQLKRSIKASRERLSCKMDI